MPFPISIDNKIVIKVKNVNISSEKYLINHIDDYLVALSFGYYSKTNNSLFFHKNDLTVLLRRKDFIDNGKIKIKITDDNIIIKIKSYTFIMFLVVLLISIPFFFVSQPQIDSMIPIFIFFWLFGMNYLTRFFAHKRLKKEIKTLIYNL